MSWSGRCFNRTLETRETLKTVDLERAVADQSLIWRSDAWKGLTLEFRVVPNELGIEEMRCRCCFDMSHLPAMFYPGRASTPPAIPSALWSSHITSG